MSRVGKKPILIPQGVDVKIDDKKIMVTGPKGSVSLDIRPEVEIVIKEGRISIYLKDSIGNRPQKKSKTGVIMHDKNIRALWGLTGASISNMVRGVTEGFEKKLGIEGIGFKANLEGTDLVLDVGFTHLVRIAAPQNIKFSLEKNIIIVSGIDKEQVGQIAAKIRKVRPPEPYKGKGIRYFGEVVRRKVGKKAVAAGSSS